MLRWSQEALRLPREQYQTDLTIEVLANRKHTKQLTHKLWLLDDETKTLETFQIDSPSPVIPPQGIPKSSASSASGSASSVSTPSAGNPASSSDVSPISFTDDSFLQEIAELGGDFKLLAAIPAVHTPRVISALGKNSPQPDAHLEAVKEKAEPEGEWEGVLSTLDSPFPRNSRGIPT